MVQINVGTSKPRPHEVIEDVWFGEPGNEWQSEAYVFTAGPIPDLLSAYLYEDEDQSADFIIKAKAGWVRDGLDPEDWAEVQARIADPDDPLRSTHVFDMYAALMTEVGKRPPTSPNGSAAKSSGTTGGAKRKRKAETSGE